MSENSGMKALIELVKPMNEGKTLDDTLDKASQVNYSAGQ